MKSLTWVEINLSNLIHNICHFQKITGEDSKILPVIKSNAYGHGLLPVAKALLDEEKNPVKKNIWGFGVVNMAEVMELREGGIEVPILILGPISHDEIDLALEKDATLIVYDIPFAREIAGKALKKKVKARVHVKVDTGLGRLSVSAEDGVEFIEDLLKIPGLHIEGLYTHLADAEGIDQSYTLRQLIRFNKLLSRLKEKNIEIPIKHMAGSAATILIPETRFNIVRVGISIYGLWPAEETKLLTIAKGQDILKILTDRDIQSKGIYNILDNFLRPVMSFKTTVTQVKDITPGNCIGYGCTYETNRLTRVAILPAGYSEGIDRKLSNCGQVLIKGRKAPVLGRICMNLTIVDVTDIPGVRVGNEAVIMGRQGEQAIRAENIAAKIGTINYEVVTRINWAVPRVYKWNGD